ncbi:MAG: hypothetical protein NDJ18_01395 [candidate division Zixibacteria bacterium]|nr:hypothetical protein [candidate division Zixibacteria bacterium]
MSSDTDPKAAALRTRLAELVTEQGRLLYVGTGLPHLFERALPVQERHFSRTWLYIPSHYLQMIRDQAGQGGSRQGVVWGDPLLCDDQPVFPLVCHGDVLAAIASDTAKLPEFSASELGAIQAWCDDQTSESTESVRAQSGTFIHELFQRDSSPQQFSKRALALLTHVWPRSCAGVYTEFEGTYHLRLASGDVSRWFRLTRQIQPDMAMRCLEAMYRQEYFVPADTLEDFPSFLDAMPDCLFIHEGILSPRSKQIILVTGPGALSRREARCLNEYARMISGLHEYQFATGAELMGEVSDLATNGTRGKTFDVMLTDLWGWLSQQISLSRLAVMPRGQADVWNEATVMQRKQDGASQIERVQIAVPASFTARILIGQTCGVQDIRTGELPESMAKERYVRHVLSESYLPLKSPDGVIGLMLVGSPSAGEYLEQEGDLLEKVAAYVSLWLQLSRTEQSAWSDSEVGRMAEAIRAEKV